MYGYNVSLRFVDKCWIKAKAQSRIDNREKHWQHWVHKTQDEDKSKQHNTICVWHHFSQTSTNNVIITWAFLQTTEGKNEPNIVIMRKMLNPLPSSFNLSSHNTYLVHISPRMVFSSVRFAQYVSRFVDHYPVVCSVFNDVRFIFNYICFVRDSCFISVICI